MTSDGLHTDRRRAESFGAVAEAYERLRPRHDPRLLDDLAALRPDAVLDVATGTGQVAIPLAERGLSVLGVEIDPRMAAVARARGVAVEVAPFETWDSAGRTFDLVTCGSAWHWIDPRRGAAKAAELLRPGGTLARFWSFHRLDDDAMAILAEVYAAHAPTLKPYGGGRSRITDEQAAVVATPDGFEGVEERSYRWEQSVSADEWAALAATLSDHQQLEPDRLAALQAAIAETVRGLGGSVSSLGETYALLATRAG